MRQAPGHAFSVSAVGYALLYECSTRSTLPATLELAGRPVRRIATDRPDRIRQSKPDQGDPSPDIWVIGPVDSPPLGCAHRRAFRFNGPGPKVLGEACVHGKTFVVIVGGGLQVTEAAKGGWLEGDVVSIGCNLEVQSKQHADLNPPISRRWRRAPGSR